MPTSNKSKSKLKAEVPAEEKNIVFFWSVVPPEETRFPKKLRKMNKILSKMKFLPR